MAGHARAAAATVGAFGAQDMTSPRRPLAPVPSPPMRTGSPADPASGGAVDDPAERNRVSLLRSLLVLSQLMFESESTRQIGELAQTAAPALGPIDHGVVRVREGGAIGSDEDRRVLAAVLDAPPEQTGPIHVPGFAWARVYRLRHRSGDFGYLAVAAAVPPDQDEEFMLGVLAQQTAAALANVHMLDVERDASRALAQVNEKLESSVEELQRVIDIHERLTTVAVSGHGRSGIAKAVHELTGLDVVIEDRHGNVRAAVPDVHDHEKADPSKLASLHRRLERRGRPLRDGDRLVALSRPRYDVMETISLVDEDGKAGQYEAHALEYASNILAMELARLHSLAETELRLRQDFLDDLVTGLDLDSALRRAQALKYDIERPHRVVVIQCDAVEGEMLLHAARRAVHGQRLGSLLGLRGGRVVVLASRDADWGAVRDAVRKELGNACCRIGVGSQCDAIEDFPRSFREAGLVLRLQERIGDSDTSMAYDNLGVFRLFASIDDVTKVQSFVQEWLGPLMDYDDGRDAELVATLSAYLEHGNYDATSAALFIHRSTLKYRLQRIREIADIDLNDPDTRFNLQLATRAHAIVGALGPDLGAVAG